MAHASLLPFHYSHSPCSSIASPMPPESRQSPEPQRSQTCLPGPARPEDYTCRNGQSARGSPYSDVDVHAPCSLPLPVPGQRPALCVMVLGTSSGAGKSWLSTALCAWYRARGLRVAPFKAQNMSNNARLALAPGGGWGEIGSAQYWQALACALVPEVRMNPLLLKPESSQRSQVVLMGRVDAALTALPWRERKAHVWPVIQHALDALRQENDVLVIEGAGSPAEINLYDSDVVNLRVARHTDAHCLLVADIDRGGAFAHLYGTWALLPRADRALIKGFVLNRFRGDARLLAPAPQQLQAMTGVPVVAVIPMQSGHGLPEEDSFFDDSGSLCPQSLQPSSSGTPALTIAIVRLPHLSNQDEFAPLLHLHGLRVQWVQQSAQIRTLDAKRDWLILPGSKATLHDLRWLREQGLDASIGEFARAGGRMLGICGGLQMLGRTLCDPQGVEGIADERHHHGLGLLDLHTQFLPEKTLARHQVQLPPLYGAWGAWSGLQVQVYEIHCGYSRVVENASFNRPSCVEPGTHTLVPGALWQNTAGNICGTYWHGLLENSALLQTSLGRGACDATPHGLDALFQRMAREVPRWFSPV